MADRKAALAAIELAEALSAPDDALNFLLTNGVRARLALADGDVDAAERCAREALRLALTTDLPLDEARARMNLGFVMQAARREDHTTRDSRLATSHRRGRLGR